MKFKNWCWNSILAILIAGCAKSSPPATTVEADTTAVEPSTVNAVPDEEPMKELDSLTNDSTPSQLKEAARKRRIESDARRKTATPYTPGKGDSWADRRMDSLK